MTVSHVLIQDHEHRHGEFHQLAYHRFFIMLLNDLGAPDPVFEAISFPVLHSFRYVHMYIWYVCTHAHVFMSGTLCHCVSLIFSVCVGTCSTSFVLAELQALLIRGLNSSLTELSLPNFYCKQHSKRCVSTSYGLWCCATLCEHFLWPMVALSIE